MDRIVAEAQAAAADVLVAVRAAAAAAPPTEAAPGSALVPQAGAPRHHHHGRALLRQRLQALAGSPLESGGPVRACHIMPPTGRPATCCGLSPLISASTFRCWVCLDKGMLYSNPAEASAL